MAGFFFPEIRGRWQLAESAPVPVLPLLLKLGCSLKSLGVCQGVCAEWMARLSGQVSFRGHAPYKHF